MQLWRTGVESVELRGSARRELRSFFTSARLLEEYCVRTAITGGSPKKAQENPLSNAPKSFFAIVPTSSEHRVTQCSAGCASSRQARSSRWELDSRFLQRLTPQLKMSVMKVDLQDDQVKSTPRRPVRLPHQLSSSTTANFSRHVALRIVADVVRVLCLSAQVAQIGLMLTYVAKARLRSGQWPVWPSVFLLCHTSTFRMSRLQ